MSKHARQRARPLAAMAACLAIGIVIGWWLRATGGPRPSLVPAFEPGGAVARSMPGASPRVTSEPRRESSSSDELSRTHESAPILNAPVISAAPAGTEAGGAVDILRTRRLRTPIDGIEPSAFKGGFSESRSGDGHHAHEAVDILAPRSTPVHAVDGGTIAKLFESRAGGHTIYQFDSAERFSYYYAHLDRYSDGLHEGQRVSAGDVIGYVGTSGNAPPGTPHLHFAIFELGPDRRWWQGKALDPYLVFRP